MQLINPATPEVWEQPKGFVGMCEHIARCAAICYDSTPKTGEDAVEFVKRLAKAGHGRALEFGTLRYEEYGNPWISRPYGNVKHIERTSTRAIVTENLRTWLENTLATGRTVDAAFDYLRKVWEVRFNPDPVLGAPRRVTVHYPAISRAIADEFRTHTTLSTLMRSTRYVSVTGSKDGMECIKPTWYDDAEDGDKNLFEHYCEIAEEAYCAFLGHGYKRQQARDLLPLCIKTELVQCGFVGIQGTGWDNFIALRTDKTAHPDARVLAEQIKELINQSN